MLNVLCGIVYISVHNDMCRGVRTDERLGFSFCEYFAPHFITVASLLITSRIHTGHMLVFRLLGAICSFLPSQGTHCTNRVNFGVQKLTPPSQISPPLVKGTRVDSKTVNFTKILEYKCFTGV